MRGGDFPADFVGEPGVDLEPVVAGFVVGLGRVLDEQDDDLCSVVAGVGTSIPILREGVEKELNNLTFWSTLLVLLIRGFGLIGLNEAMIFS